jgi:Protein of unknown function (DUF1566)
MQSLSNELKSVISKRLEAAGAHEVLAIASALCEDEITEIVIPRRDVQSGARFAVDGDTVLDRRTGLQWSRDNVPGLRMNWNSAQEACKALKLGGHSDWRLPTIRELLTIVDYERHEPAIDTDAFKCESTYYWTSTPVASSPGGYAWDVFFGSGGTYYGGRGYVSCVRAVRASQDALDLWHVK